MYHVTFPWNHLGIFWCDSLPRQMCLNRAKDLFFEQLKSSLQTTCMRAISWESARIELRTRLSMKTCVPALFREHKAVALQHRKKTRNTAATGYGVATGIEFRYRTHTRGTHTAGTPIPVMLHPTTFSHFTLRGVNDDESPTPFLLGPQPLGFAFSGFGSGFRPS